MSEVHIYVPIRDMNYGERRCVTLGQNPVQF